MSDLPLMGCFLAEAANPVDSLLSPRLENSELGFKGLRFKPHKELKTPGPCSFKPLPTRNFSSALANSFKALGPGPGRPQR